MKFNISLYLMEVSDKLCPTAALTPGKLNYVMTCSMTMTSSVWWSENKKPTHVVRGDWNCVPGVRGYSWTTLPLEDINTEAWHSRVGVGHGANTPTLLKSLVMKVQSKESGWTIARWLDKRRRSNDSSIFMWNVLSLYRSGALRMLN